ncbi:MAG: ACP S-malonyltransferase [Actinobacteria bacterium]|nr:ACP S-malonyltransferase [Actinomycetota bacterium]
MNGKNTKNTGDFKRIALMFPGQGSQYQNMGEEFLGANGKYRKYFEISSEIVGKDILKIISGSDRDNSLDNTRFSQISIYTLSCALNDYIVNDLFINMECIYTVLGHSLGEYSAIYSGGAYSFEQGVKLVGYRGKIMSEADRSAKGMMAAVLGTGISIIEDVLGGLKDRVFVANYNDYLQIVISGCEDAVGEAIKELKSRGVRKIIPLKVGIASHSPLMKEVSDKLGRFIEENVKLTDMKLPFFSTTEVAYRDRNDIKKTLTGQLTGPIRWVDSIEYLLGKGVGIFVEVGPGEVLSGLVSRIAQRSGKDIIILDTNKMEDIDNLKNALKKEGIINEA